MDYRYRTALYKLLDRIPSKLGYGIYHFLQKKLGDTDIETKIREAKNSVQTVKQILDQHGITLDGKNIIEIGSGWVPVVPYLFLLHERAALVDTYDINEHFDRHEIDYLNKYFNISKSDCKTGKYRLIQNINYFPNTDVAQADLTNADIIFSRFVLEHVPPSVISKMHDSFYKKMKPGAYILHLISPSDHRAYSDDTLSLFDFLQYSEQQWNRIQTKFDYHNRLRLPHYMDLLTKKFELIFINYSSPADDSLAFKKFKMLNIHSDYSMFTDEQLIAGSINILLRKKL